METIGNWFQKRFSDPQVVLMLLVLALGIFAVVIFGKILVPVLVALVVAYLLEGPVALLERRRIPRLAAVVFVFLVFLGISLFILLWLFPFLWHQVWMLIQQLPSMISWGQEQLLLLIEEHPNLISPEQVTNLAVRLRSELIPVQRIFSLSVQSAENLMIFFVYIFLVPFLAFFFLKDKNPLIEWFTRFLPEDRPLVTEVWQEVNQQIGNFVRGKVWQIAILWTVSFVVFSFLGLQFAMLIGLFMGLSVLIPFIGVIVMAIPVILIGYFQWGWSTEFIRVILAYVVLQTIDGNVVAPLLFSEKVSMHPIAIVVAVLVFGAWWGFWGLFFAIPLATLLKAVLSAWKRRGERPATP